MSDEAIDAVAGPSLLVMGVCIVFLVGLIWATDVVFPRDATAAKIYLEERGWSSLETVDAVTGTYCGRNEKYFYFIGQRDDGKRVSGKLCFHLIRPLNWVRSDYYIRPRCPENKPARYC